MTYRTTTWKTPTARRIDWDGQSNYSPTRWILPIHLSFNIPLLLKVRDIGLIVLAAVVAAAAVLIVTVVLALPLLCPDGSGSDRCSATDGEIMTAELPPAPTVQMPAQAAGVALPFSPPRRSFDRAATRQDEIADAADVPPAAAESPEAEPTKNLVQFFPTLDPQIRKVKTIAIHAELAPAVVPPQPPAPKELQNLASKEMTAVPPAMIVPIPEPAHKRPPSAAPEKRSDSSPNRGTRSTKAAAGAMTVAGAGVTVRSGPSKSRSSLFALGAGEKIAVLKSEKGWLQVRDSQGRVGWAYSRFLR
jgi:hypothetical protein